MNNLFKRKEITHVRAYPDTKLKLKELCREISYVQREEVRTPEIIRRAFNIPNIKEILLADAKMKAQNKKR
jgi:hypothetical protein